MTTGPAIGFLPYGTRLGPALARMPLERLSWPLGLPSRLEGGVVGDLGPEDHLITLPNSSVHFRLKRGSRARFSLVFGEPSTFHARHLRLLRLTHRRFFRVLSFNEDLLARIPNGIFFPFGSTWVPEWRQLDPQKTRMVSLIASARRESEGHRLRHAVAERLRHSGQDVEILGRGYCPFARKAEGLAPYRYSVVIENVRERNYFSEKLVDAVLCDTVPIYWGCPNIDRFVDPSGMILCESEADILRAVAAASPEDYAARLPKLRAIRETMARFGAFERRAAEAVRDSLPS